jgi:hypothetical protein
VIEQIGSQQAFELLQAIWQHYFTIEFVQNKKRNTHFIKQFEQQAQVLFDQSNPQLSIKMVEAQPLHPELSEQAHTIKKIKPQQESLLNNAGKKFGSLKCSESLKGKTVVSIRMSVEDLDEYKLDKIKKFLQELA